MKRILAALLGLLLAPAIFASTVVKSNQTIPLIGEINQPNAAAVIDKIHELNRGKETGPIYIVINSPGGDVLAGFAIIQAIDASRRPVYTVDVGFAASMAAIIHSYGAKRYMTPRSVLMYHEMAIGNDGYVPIGKLASQLRFIGVLQNQANEHLAQVSGVPLIEIQVREADEWWVMPKEAKDRHLVDEIVVVDDYPTHPEDQ